MEVRREKCVRCGENWVEIEPAEPNEIGFLQLTESIPICGVCAAERSRKAREEASKSPRHCPVDSTSLRRDHIGNIMIERCPSCHGIWLDAGELELIQGAVKAEAESASSASGDGFASGLLLGTIIG